MEKTNLTATVVALDSSVTDLEEEFEEIDDKLTDMQDELNRVRKSIEFGASEFLRKEKEEQLTK